MRIVKTTKTIGKSKWIARMSWSGHNINSDDIRIFEDLFGKDIVVLVPKKYEKTGINFLNFFVDDLKVER